ncbi:hypothetical protein LWI29_030170 [Acer saccharum]|uniref:Uncharacterized protein n=1 Tax=Acer saccharum TaxID=4024 RepID=A0AA39W4F4_ACESA|nr:hypothetical protein LWI29_030170 [Acer saccharum]
MVKSGVRWPPNSGLPQQNLRTSGPPVTLSVVSRIRNGTNGWRGSVSGAAAAATGKVSPLSGAIASSFYNCKGNNEIYAGGNSSKTKNHLLVFSLRMYDTIWITNISWLGSNNRCVWTRHWL